MKYCSNIWVFIFIHYRANVDKIICQNKVNKTNISAILSFSCNYFQYKAIISASSACHTTYFQRIVKVSVILELYYIYFKAYFCNIAFY